MAECIVLKGGGADLDAVTAGAGDVLAGKVIVGSDGEPLTGTLALSGNATASQVLAGSTFYNTDPKSKLTGTIASLGGQTINPSASQQTVSSSGKYMTGNVVVNAVSNLAAANIKKGVVVGGVTGTFEGYVPTATDLYLRGNNIAGFTATQSDYIKFDSGQISVSGTSNVRKMATSSSQNLSGFSNLNIEMNVTSLGSSPYLYALFILSTNNYVSIGQITPVSTGSRVYSFDLTANQKNYPIEIQFYNTNGAVYHIWKS